ncbi:DNA-binding response regulator [Erysipelotrichaceae bacterium OH741_COT-311]|nr:DNA-binding response regulator [Erysipelotrichaceae bacterium OH741_COT-311]
MNRILLVEDDPLISTKLTEFLENEHFLITQARNKKEALDKVFKDEYDLVLLDISLPDGSGYDICKEIKSKMNVPIIFVTASNDEPSVILGLDIGADDYIAKPYRPKELLSRIRSVLRRTGKTSSIFELHGIKVDTIKGLVTRDGKEIFLSSLEYRILLVFLSNRGIVLSRAKLVEEIWDIAGDYLSDNTLTVYIKRLRQKIEEDIDDPKIIKTVRGIGYISE